MRKQLFTLVLTFAVSLIMSCAGTESAVVSNAKSTDTQIIKETGQDFSAVTGKDWKLIAVYIDGKAAPFTRDKLTNEAFKDFFTLSFNTDAFGTALIGGRGAPNHYNAPYSIGSSQSINIMPMRSTQMALLFELEILNEYDFFSYLQNANTWKLVNEKLEFLSKTKDSKEVRLVFSM